MADETPKNNLDAWLEQAEARELSGVVQPDRPQLTPTPGTEPPKPVETIEPLPAGDVKPEDMVRPPAPETPPAAAAPPVEPPPPAPDAEDPTDPAPEHHKGKKRPSWKMIRELEQQVKEEREARLRGEISREDYIRNQASLETQLQEMRQRLEGAPAQPETPAEEIPPLDPDDPISVMRHENLKLRQEVQALAQRTQLQTAQQQLDATISRQEAEFRQARPDYNDAMRYYIDSERREHEATGALSVMGAEIMRRDPQFVRQRALRDGVDEATAAKNIAFDGIVAAKRDVVVRSALTSGKPIPQAVVEAAEARGYRRSSETPAAPTPPAAPVKRDSEAVREASRSLSALPNTAPPPPPLEIRTRAELMQLKGKDLEAYIMRKDAEDPEWERRLA